MKLKNYGFIIKAPDYKQDKTSLKSENFSSTIIGVSSIEEAYIAVDELIKNGIEIIELCGGFEKDGYDLIKQHIKGKVPVGYVVFEKDI